MKYLDTLGILIHYYSIINNKGQEINNLLKERVYTYSIGINSNSDEQAIVAANTLQIQLKAKLVTSSNPVQQSKVTKVPSQSKAQRNKVELQKKIDVEAKLARPKIQRPSVYIPKELSEVNNISINKTIKEVLRPELLQKSNII